MAGSTPRATSCQPDELLHIDADSAALLASWFDVGARALSGFAPELAPQLWPEHFDVGITLDRIITESHRATQRSRSRIPMSDRGTNPGTSRTHSSTGPSARQVLRAKCRRPRSWSRFSPRAAHVQRCRPDHRRISSAVSIGPHPACRLAPLADLRGELDADRIRPPLSVRPRRDYFPEVVPTPLTASVSA